MTDDVADRTRILARPDASQAVAADPLRDGTEQLRSPASIVWDRFRTEGILDD